MEPEEIQKLALFEDNYWWGILRRQIIAQTINHYLNRPRDLRILDLGCGTGGTTKILRFFGRVTALDGSREALNFFKEKVPEIETIQIDLEQGGLPFGDNSFDLVTAFDVLEHLKGDEAILKEVKRVLKPQGKFLLTVPAHMALWSYRDDALGHYRRYRKKELKNKLLKAGFKVTILSWFNFFLFPLVALTLIALRLAHYQKSLNYMEDKPLLNPVLTYLAKIEARFFSFIKFPFGISLLALSEKANLSDLN